MAPLRLLAPLLLCIGVTVSACSSAPSEGDESGSDVTTTQPKAVFQPNFETQNRGAFSVANASWLARAADVVYENRADEVAVKSRLLEVVKNLGSDVHIDDYRYFDATDDTQAAYLATDRIAILAFRGTTDKTDVATDRDTKKIKTDDADDGQIHSGFYRSFKGVWDGTTLRGDGMDKESMRDFLKRVRKDSKVPLYVTGHSLGAALATLTTRAALEEGVHVDALYTFGSPRVGTEKFAGDFAALAQSSNTWVYRVVNYGDGITLLPKSGYKHVALPGEEEQEHNSRFVFLSKDSGVYYTATAHGQFNFLHRLSGYFADLFTLNFRHHPITNYICKLDRVIDPRTSCTQGSEQTFVPTAQPNRVCLDTADAVARAGERCGNKYKDTYDAYIAAGAGGSCDNVTGIRDESSLRQTCFARIASAPCEELAAGNLDASCQDQLLTDE